MAVYTKISKEEIKLYLADFDIGGLVSLDGIEGGINNTNYKLVTTEGKFILTIIEQPEYKDNMNFYLSFMNCLSEKKIPCPRVVRNKDKEQVTLIKNKPSIISSFIEGKHITDIKYLHLESLGVTIANMHLSVDFFDVNVKNIFSLSSCKKIINSCGNSLDKIETGLFALLKEEFSFLENNKIEGLPSGVIHGDLFPDNIFFDKNNKINGIIDFYLSCADIFIYDLMVTANAWCFNSNGEVDNKKLYLLFKNYESIRKLSLKEKEALSFYGRVAALRIITSRSYDWLNPVKEALVIQHNPKAYLNILKFYKNGGFIYEGS